jgi:hypothetical protein
LATGPQCKDWCSTFFGFGSPSAFYKYNGAFSVTHVHWGALSDEKIMVNYMAYQPRFNSAVSNYMTLQKCDNSNSGTNLCTKQSALRLAHHDTNNGAFQVGQQSSTSTYSYKYEVGGINFCEKTRGGVGTQLSKYTTSEMWINSIPKDSSCVIFDPKDISWTTDGKNCITDLGQDSSDGTYSLQRTPDQACASCVPTTSWCTGTSSSQKICSENDLVRGFALKSARPIEKLLLV